MRTMYLLFSPSRVHVYGSYNTAIRIYRRAKRMGAKNIEFVQAKVKPGDLYSNTKPVQALPYAGTPFYTYPGMDS